MITMLTIIEFIKLKNKLQENITIALVEYAIILVTMKPIERIDMHDGVLSILRELRLFTIFAVPFVLNERSHLLIALLIAILNEIHMICVIEPNVSQNRYLLISRVSQAIFPIVFACI